MNKLRLKIPVRVDTERLVLRPYRPGDGPLLFQAGLRNRKHLELFERGNFLRHFKNEAQAEKTAQGLAIEWQARKQFFWGIFERETDRWVGQIYVGPTSWDLPEYTLGYVSDVEFEGRGLISEAVRRILDILFHDMKAHRVRSDCNETNSRSWKLLERCGFRREGHLRENKKNPDGTFHGDYLYALLHTEYRRGRGVTEQSAG